MAESTEALSEHQALMVLNGLPGMGPVLMNRMLSECGGDPRAVLGASRELLLAIRGVTARAAASVAEWREHFDLSREECWMKDWRCDFVSVRDPDYPPLLRETHDPPIGLYRCGHYTLQDPCVAIVGSRKTTPYGLGVAKEMAAGLVHAGFCVVSGLAVGIDAAAHEGALEAGGKTVAVLGNGMDIDYPRQNTRLRKRIAESCAVLSEFPFERPADKRSFAMRNRIVSGMSRAVVVIESDVDGGSMITARFAGEQGRILCAVPGRVDQASSRGCHQLIRDGATLVTNVEEVLSELNYLKGMDAGSLRREVSPAFDLTDEERRMLACFKGGEALGVDALMVRLGGEVGILGASLLMLEMKGCVSRRIDGTYEAV